MSPNPRVTTLEASTFLLQAEKPVSPELVSPLTKFPSCMYFILPFLIISLQQSQIQVSVDKRSNSDAMATEPPRDTTEPSGGNLCATCSVIPFNDERLASFILTQDRREPCWDTIGAAGIYPRNPKSVTKGRYPVDYRVVDFLPTLPCLEQSALRGCDFCSLLRLEIIRAGFDYTGFVEITLVYRLGADHFPTLGLAALVAQLTWRPDIPSIPPASPEPDILHDCIVFALESDSSKCPGRARRRQLLVSISLISPHNFPAEVASWLKIPSLRGEAPLSEENIQFMTDALADCVLNCNHYIATDFLPSRLLYLGPQTSLECIRLIDSSQIVRKDGSYKPRYAALSYCWGSSLATDGAEQLRAKVDSVESMRRHVPKEGISRVILDAIKVCKALSIHFLWVDSLCIIQDDICDWETESASMTLIYSNAFVTISTPLSSASNEGFLVRHRRQVAVPFQSRVVPSINGHYNLVASGTCHERRLFGWPDLDIRGTSWESRGWTFQEYEMSNRLLIFGTSMVHFQCRHLVSENGYRRETSLLPRRVETLDHPHLDLENYRFSWQWILNCYGDRLFTFDEDRLPGISGMAKYTADKTGDEYLAGLWKTQLPSSLVWYPHLNHAKHHVEFPDLLDSLRSPKPYIAPSWSPLRLNVSVGKGTFIVYFSPLSAERTVVDASVISVGKNPFGRVQHGRIRIRVERCPSYLISPSFDVTPLPTCGILGTEEPSHTSSSIGLLQGKYATEGNY